MSNSFEKKPEGSNYIKNPESNVLSPEAAELKTQAEQFQIKVQAKEQELLALQAEALKLYNPSWDEPSLINALREKIIHPRVTIDLSIVQEFKDIPKPNFKPQIEHLYNSEHIQEAIQSDFNIGDSLKIVNVFVRHIERYLVKFDGGNINMSRYSGQELFSFNYSNEQEFVSYARYQRAIEDSFNQFVGKIDQNIEQTKIQIAQGEVKYSEFMQKHKNTLANLKKNPLTLEQFQIETQAKNLLSQLQTSLARFEASKSRITSLNQFHETIAKKLMAEYETDPQTRFDERSRDFRSLINPSWNFIMSEAQTSQSDRIPGESMVNIQRNTKPILTLVDLLDFIPDNLSLPNWKDIRPKLTVDSPIPSDLELAENISFTDYFNQAYLALAPVEENQNLDKIEKYLENCEAEFVKFYEKHGESLEIEQNNLLQEIEQSAKI